MLSLVILVRERGVDMQRMSKSILAVTFNVVIICINSMKYVHVEQSE